jgi:light-independent protochlorophyllide reductase subunit N
VIKLDLARAAERLSKRFMPRVRVLNYSGSGIETTFTQGEDACLAALARAAPTDATEKLVVLGALPDIVEDQFRRCFEAIGITSVEFLPARTARALPAIGPGAKLLLAQPFLAETTRLLEDRGATRIDALFPFGANGSMDWFVAAGAAFGISEGDIRTRLEPMRARAERALAPLRAQLQGKTIFFFPDSQLEAPLARFLSDELGMIPLEVGSPYLHATHMARELARLGADVRLSEGQDVERQLDRCRQAKPDIVVCGLGLANPLEAEGFTTKWAIELVFSPIHGFDQAGDLAGLFSRPIARRALLKV